jgi:hypothetical protein
LARIDGYRILANEPFRVVKIGAQMTFSSSFLPIMLYQEFIQLLMDRPGGAPAADTPAIGVAESDNNNQ